jgi:protein-disulfide isomerase
VGTAVRLVLAAVWLYAGVSKLGSPGEFVVAVKAYRLLPGGLAHAVGYGLPAAEVVVGLLLLAGLATRFAAVVSAGLYVVFLAGVGSAAARGLSIDCGCFGGGGQVAAGHTRYTLEILRDAGLLVGALFLAVWPVSRYAADGAVRAGAVPTRVDPAARRTRAARERAEQVLARQRAEARRRLRVVAAVSAVALVAVTGVGMAVQAKRDQPTRVAGEVGYRGPVSAVGTAGVVVGYPDAPVTLDLYEDFMCPVCGYFESHSGAAVLQLAAEHKARVRYHMLNFLDRSSAGTQYSTRAANAAACAADDGLPFVRLHALLYAHQPAEGSPGLTDQQLIDYGVQAGAPRAPFTACVQARAHAAWPAQQTAATATVPNFQGTPTVRLGNQDLDWRSTSAITAAVNAAAAAPAR